MSKARYLVPWDWLRGRSWRTIVDVPDDVDGMKGYEIVVGPVWDGCVSIEGTVPFRLQYRLAEGLWCDVEDDAP